MAQRSVAFLCVMLAWLPSAVAADKGADSDNDGIPDRLEQQTGTNPLLRDSDGDGVPDGIEDRD